MGSNVAATVDALVVAKQTSADQAVATNKWDVADDDERIPPPPLSATDRPRSTRPSPS